MRRKLGIIILYTTQNFGMIPPRIRFYTHTLVFCRDLYYGHQYTDEPRERGIDILTRRMDLKGFYTGREGTVGRAQVLNHANSVWKNYNTKGLIDVKWGLIKYSKQDLLNYMNANGGSASPGGLNIEGNKKEFIGENIQGVSDYQLSKEEKDSLIGMWVEQIRQTNLSEIPSSIVKERIAALGITIGDKELGSILKRNGVGYRALRDENYYVFTIDD
jgi:hypothetical protein